MSEILVQEGWRERLERLGGRRRDAVVVVAAVAVVGLGALLLWMRNPPAQIAPPAPPVADPAAEPVTAASSALSPSAVVLVHVSGAVTRPGLYELPLGARVADALDLAKGPRRAADLDAVNLAEPLVDGQKLDIPKRGETAGSAPPPPAVAPSAGPTPGAVIDLNTADQAALETIPGVGPVTAAAILAHRDEIGGFDAIDQLLEVSGIGPATLESIRPYVTI